MEENNKYYEQYGALYLKQLELELAYKTEAEEILKASLELACANGEAAKTKIGGKLIDYAFDTTRDNMKALITAIKKPKSGVVPAYMSIAKELLTIYEHQEDTLINLFSLSSLANLISYTFLNKNTISEVALSIAEDIESEAKVEAFFKFKEEKEGKFSPELLHNFDEGLKKRIQRSYKVAYAINRMNKEDFKRCKWSQKAKLALGAKILECALKGSGYFEESINNDGLAIIEPKDWLSRTWTKNSEVMQTYAHKFCPTIIPPREWKDPYLGGYYGGLQRFSSLLRLHITQTDSFIKEYKKRLQQVDLSYIYKAINSLQETPFVINKKLLDVSEKILASGGGLGLPQTEPIPQLPELVGEFTEEELKEHKRKMVGIIKQNQARTSKALRATMSISTAKKFADYDKIYFPWNMDYRGRCYPIPASLSPQGDDLTKALLLFAEPQACKNANDYRWLAIHGANLAGHDKIPFNERIEWVQNHTNDILSSAKEPLSYTWWYEESKGDYPLEFLAFCFEWQRLQEWLKDHESCIGFKSGLAIAFDGTCSGLQHFSALLRDEVGGQAVNLIPSNQVQDIYGIVAKKVNKVLLQDCLKGGNDEYKKDKEGNFIVSQDGNKLIKYGSKTLAQTWLTYARTKFGTEGITRKVCKRSVMTLAYGSGKYGFANNLLEDVIKPFTLAHPDNHPFLAKQQAAQYMAGLIWNAVSTTVVKAVEGMDYLQKLAGLISKKSAVVTWTTPNGLPVQQNYFKVETTVFKMRFNGLQKRFYTQETTGNIDKVAQKNAISPNFIHAMDACHLQRVVVTSKNLGNNNFAMIHDSFGTDMAQAGILFKTIRSEFVKLYDNQDYLADFLNDVAYLIDKDAKLPDKPSFGNLEIQQVANSDFCFA